jgi:uncharacterized protein (DUF779 family)
MLSRVDITPTAADMVRMLTTRHGALMFHQSGGCCDGSVPMCYPQGKFYLGKQDVLLSEIAGTPFYMSAFQYEYWQHSHLTIDLIPGRGSSFSVETPEGVRFITRSRLFSDAELAELANNSTTTQQGNAP